MRRRTTSYDKSYVGSSQSVLKSHSLRKRRVPVALAQFVAQAQACGLTLAEAKRLAAVQVGVAANIAANPHRREEILLAADKATTDAVMAILARRAERRAA